MKQVMINYTSQNKQLDMKVYGRDKMADILQMTFSKAFSSVKNYGFWFICQ